MNFEPDCRLHDYVKESWRNAYCWDETHDPCPWGLPKHRGLLRSVRHWDHTRWNRLVWKTLPRVLRPLYHWVWAKFFLSYVYWDGRRWRSL